MSILRRFDASEESILTTQNNLVSSYGCVGRFEDALPILQDVYFGRLKLLGAQNRQTSSAASNYASTLVHLKRFEEAKSLLRKTVPVARRALGESNATTLRMRLIYGQSLYGDTGATLDDVREAVTTLEDAERTARRVLGGAHPFISTIDPTLAIARGALARRTECVRRSL